MSYYIDHVMICDQLAFGRMVEAWKQRGWEDRCILCRPDHIWITTRDNSDGTDAVEYLMYFLTNHGPTQWEVVNWVTDELGLDFMHFSLWTKEACDMEWHQDGLYLPDDTMPSDTFIAAPKKDCTGEQKAPEKYTEYEYCYISVDTDVWKEMSMDYTREEGIRQQSPVEELLLEISARLERMEELIECLVKEGRERYVH